jgi:hypothetical protein
MPNHCSRSAYVLCNLVRNNPDSKHHATLFASGLANCKKSAKMHETCLVTRQKSMDNAYRLRKKCAGNVHFSKKHRESDRDNYFPWAMLAREKMPRSWTSCQYCRKKDRARRSMSALTRHVALAIILRRVVVLGGEEQSWPRQL